MSNLRPKMTPLERAKQFMPFAALKGYEEALRKREEEIEKQALKREVTPYDDINAESSDTPSD
ncbi:MAG: hypothetical protein J6X48_05300 [Lachnospiraceae bacterium]|nr:hypothetical protein [Lachnospiraceae bacterium]